MNVESELKAVAPQNSICLVLNHRPSLCSKQGQSRSCCPSARRPTGQRKAAAVGISTSASEHALLKTDGHHGQVAHRRGGRLRRLRRPRTSARQETRRKQWLISHAKVVDGLKQETFVE